MGALARDFVRRVEAIADRALVPTLIRELTDDCDDATLLALLWALTIHARYGDEGSRRVSQELALNAEMFAHLAYERVSDLYAAARAAGIGDIAAIFLPAWPKRNPTVEEAGAENEALTLPLGVRKQASRTRDRLLIDRLLRDTNPQVIGVLLNNPHLRERDVVFIAARRPTQAAVLRVVAAHPRWCTRYAVRKALACNPYTPVAIATRLLETLLRQDLLFIGSVGVLPPEVRAEAHKVLQCRPVQAVQMPQYARPAPPEESAEDDDIDSAAEAALAMLGGPLRRVGEPEEEAPRKVADSHDGRSWWAGGLDDASLDELLSELES